MNHLGTVFLMSFFLSLMCWYPHMEPDTYMETAQTLIPQMDVDRGKVTDSFRGERWVSSNLSQNFINQEWVYSQEDYETLFLDTEDFELLSENMTSKSLPPWMEQKECLSSPLIVRPIWTRITSPYGMRVHPVSKRRHLHAGIDFRGKSGTPVVAAASGYVGSVRRKGAYGKTIVLIHTNNYTTLYGHLSAYAIKPGQWVQQGQTLGYIGRTGIATGPHLHFEIRCHNIPLNPTNYLGQKNRLARVYFRKKWNPLDQKSKRVRVALRKHHHHFHDHDINIDLKKLRTLSNRRQKGFN